MDRQRLVPNRNRLDSQVELNPTKSSASSGLLLLDEDDSLVVTLSKTSELDAKDNEAEPGKSVQYF